MESQKVKYLKQICCPDARYGEVVCKEVTGELLQVCNDGSFVIKNDETNMIDIISNLYSFSIKFI